MRGYTEILERLLQHSEASTEVRDSMQETPLMLAACYHNPAAVRLLLDAGANPRAVDWRGKDALAYASKSAAKAKKEDYDQVVKLLEHAIAESSKPLTSDALIHAKSHHHDHHAVAKKTGRGGESEEVLKAKGNQAFGCENYAKAIDYYTQAIQINESNHLLYANRAACYLALGQPMFAKVDAIKCVGIEPKYVKGHYRLAEAHMMLHDYERALRDVETGLKIAPTEPSFAELKQKIEHIIAERDYLPADKPIEGLTQFPQAKYLHPRRDVIFGSGSNTDGSLRVWAGVVHYIDATLWSNCLQLRVLLRNLGERALALTKADVFQWTLAMRNGISRIRAKQPENERENLADPSHVSIIEVNGSDISSKQLESVVLGQGNWAIVSFAFRVPMARYESEALKRSASLTIHVNDPSGGPGETRKEVEVSFNQDTIKKYYKGFRPGLICGQPGTGEAIFPKWRPDPGLTASEKKMVLSSNFNDEEFSHGFALKIRDADSKFVVYSYILIKSMSFDEIKKAAKDLLDKENLRKDVRSLIKNPERVFLRNDEDLKKANVCDDSELDVDFQPYPLDDID